MHILASCQAMLAGIESSASSSVSCVRTDDQNWHGCPAQVVNKNETSEIVDAYVTATPFECNRDATQKLVSCAANSAQVFAGIRAPFGHVEHQTRNLVFRRFSL